MNQILNGTSDGNTGTKSGSGYTFVKDGLETGVSAFVDVTTGIANLRNSKANLQNAKNKANESNSIYWRGSNSNSNNGGNTDLTAYLPFAFVGLAIVAVALVVSNNNK